MSEAQDLESLLCNELGNKVVLVESKIESMLPLGENFAGKIFKVDAIIRKEQKLEKLNLVAKMMPDSEALRKMFDSPASMEKEAFFYKELIPSYRKLEQEFGIKETIDIAPEFYGARLGEINAVLLMQNLNCEGFYMADRRKGLNLDQAEAVISLLARFHGLGIAMKYHKPEYFEILKTRSRCINLQFQDSADQNYDYFLGLIKDHVKDSELLSHIKKALKVDFKDFFFSEPSEPWSTIIHSDLWINNMMFCKKSDKVTGVKFIDFQNYLYTTPQRDLAFFLALNLDNYTMENKFNELIDFYYSSFINVIKNMKCDVNLFKRNVFDEILRTDAYKEFFVCVWMTKTMTMNVQDNENIRSEDLLMNKIVYPEFLNKLHFLVDIFIQKNWFCIQN